MNGLSSTAAPKKIKVRPGPLALPPFNSTGSKTGQSFGRAEMEAGLASGMNLKDVWEGATKDVFEIVVRAIPQVHFPVPATAAMAFLNRSTTAVHSEKLRHQSASPSALRSEAASVRRLDADPVNATLAQYGVLISASHMTAAAPKQRSNQS